MLYLCTYISCSHLIRAKWFTCEQDSSCSLMAENDVSAPTQPSIMDILQMCFQGAPVTTPQKRKATATDDSPATGRKTKRPGPAIQKRPAANVKAEPEEAAAAGKATAVAEGSTAPTMAVTETASGQVKRAITGKELKASENYSDNFGIAVAEGSTAPTTLATPAADATEATTGPTAPAIESSTADEAAQPPPSSNSDTAAHAPAEAAPAEAAPVTTIKRHRRRRRCPGGHRAKKGADALNTSSTAAAEVTPVEGSTVADADVATHEGPLAPTIEGPAADEAAQPPPASNSDTASGAHDAPVETRRPL